MQGMLVQSPVNELRSSKSVIFHLDDVSLGSWQIPRGLGSGKCRWPQAMARWEYTGGTSSCQTAAEGERTCFELSDAEKPTLSITIRVFKSPILLPAVGVAAAPAFSSAHAHILQRLLFRSRSLPWSRLQALTCVKLLLRTRVEVSWYDSAGPCASARMLLIPGCGFQPSSARCSVHSQQDKGRPQRTS